MQQVITLKGYIDKEGKTPVYVKGITDPGPLLCYKCGNLSNLGELTYSGKNHCFICKNCRGKRVSRLTEVDFLDKLEEINRRLVDEILGIEQVGNEELESRIGSLELELEELKAQLK